MRSATVTILLAQAYAKEPVLNHGGATQEFIDKLVDDLVDRKLGASRLRRVDLDNTMLGKPGHHAIPLQTSPHFVTSRVPPLFPPEGRLQSVSYTRAGRAGEKEYAPDGSQVISVGIIGGGVAGLACAQRLSQLGIQSVVFDTGKRGPGGRASSRQWRGHLVDHAAQFVATTDPEFTEVLSTSGAARRWGNDGRFGTLGKSGYSPISDGVDRWVGVEGFGSIVTALARGIDVQQDVWISPSNGISHDENGSWRVKLPGNNGNRGNAWFDAIVIAHNGKCAQRLTSTTPAREVHTLLRTDFRASLAPNAAPGSGKFTLNSVYSLLFEVPQGIMPKNFDAVFVENEPSLRWISSNTAKLQKAGAKNSEAWTVLSSAAFGKRNKAPQEFLEGTPKEAEVTSLLLKAVENALGLLPGTLEGSVLATKLQLWGAGLPINRWASKDGVDFAWSAAHQIGIAGDWLSSSPAQASTVEAAWLSGVRLAEHVAKRRSSDAGIELGETGGAFVPIQGDFGGGGNAASAWVASAEERQMMKGKGRGRWKGKGKGRGGSRPGGGKNSGTRRIREPVAGRSEE